MKTQILIILCGLIFNFVGAQNTLTKEERNKATDHLIQTQNELLKTIEGLRPEQLNFKADETSWSIAQCMEHLAASESSIWGIVEMQLPQSADPSMQPEVKMSDEQILGVIVSREQKIKTRPELEPTDRFGSFNGSVEEFKSKRIAHIEYINVTNADLRNRYYDFPFGKLDLYQVVMFMSGHTQRHTDQIKEVIANQSFPTF